MARCGFEFQDLEKKFKGTNNRFDDMDFNYEDIHVHDRKAYWKRPHEFIL
jgi:hypothetical protein